MSAVPSDTEPSVTLLDTPMDRLPWRRGGDEAKPHGVVLALGSGGARGMAHIGVLQVLAEHAIPVRAIAGTSIGAEIGAFVASGMSLVELTRIATEFDWIETLQLFMPDWPGGGLVSGKNIIAFLNRHLSPFQIEDLVIPYLAIAADLESGAQVIIDKGPLVDAVRASISIPGIMPPHILEHYRLIDGEVVNPLPFDIARERFGGPVIAVAVGSASQKPRHAPPQPSQWRERVGQLLAQPWIQRAVNLRHWLEEQFNNSEKPPKSAWTARRITDRANDIRQQKIVELRTQLSPPDLIITPDVGHIGVLEFYQAAAAIAAGREAALAHLPALRQLLESRQSVPSI